MLVGLKNITLTNKDWGDLVSPHSKSLCMYKSECVYRCYKEKDVSTDDESIERLLKT